VPGKENDERFPDKKSPNIDYINVRTNSIWQDETGLHYFVSNCTVAVLGYT